MKAGLVGLKGLRRLQRGSGRIGKLMQKLSQKLREKAEKLLKKVPGGSKARNLVDRAICFITGHPVDVATTGAACA